MGREIRRVPKGWEHPKDEHGYCRPLYDETYKEASEKWLAEDTAWRNGTHPDKEKAQREYGCKHYKDWGDDPPEEEFYRPEFDSVPDCYQIYENVTEGTPVSPIFDTEEAMAKWLIDEGYSESATRNFIERGYAPSMVFSPRRGLQMGIHTCED